MSARRPTAGFPRPSIWESAASLRHQADPEIDDLLGRAADQIMVLAVDLGEPDTGEQRPTALVNRAARPLADFRLPSISR